MSALGYKRIINRELNASQARKLRRAILETLRDFKSITSEGMTVEQVEGKLNARGVVLPFELLEALLTELVALGYLTSSRQRREEAESFNDRLERVPDGDYIGQAMELLDWVGDVSTRALHQATSPKTYEINEEGLDLLRRRKVSRPPA